MTSKIKMEKELCEILECNPRELPEASKRISWLGIQSNKVIIHYYRDGILCSHNLNGGIESLLQTKLAYLRGIRVTGMFNKKLHVHKWPEGLREIHWSGNAEELFMNLARFTALSCLQLKDAADTDNMTLPRKIAGNLSTFSATGLDVRKLDGFDIQSVELHSPKHFEDFPRSICLENFTGAGLSTADGIRNMPHLQRLVIRCSRIADISALSVLGEPRDAEFDGVDLETRYITLTGGYVHDIAPLGGIVKLETLDISDNLVEDIAPLSGLNLYHLNLSHNPVESVAALEAHTKLETLDMRDTYIRDISPLAKLPNLRELSLDVETLRDRRQLAELSSLESINGMDISEALWYFKVNR